MHQPKDIAQLGRYKNNAHIYAVYKRFTSHPATLAAWTKEDENSPLLLSYRWFFPYACCYLPYLLRCPCVGHIYICNYYITLKWTLDHYVVSFFAPITVFFFFFKSILSDMSIGTSAFFCFSFAWNLRLEIKGTRKKAIKNTSRCQLTNMLLINLKRQKQNNWNNPDFNLISMKFRYLLYLLAHEKDSIFLQ